METHKINWTEDSEEPAQRYCGYSAFKGENTFGKRKTNGIEVQS